jgi:hypothetical protein
MLQEAREILLSLQQKNALGTEQKGWLNSIQRTLEQAS